MLDYASINLQAERKRPTGLTIVAILSIIASSFCLIVAVLSIVTATVAIPFLAQVGEDIKIENKQSSDFNGTYIKTALNEIKRLSAFSGFFLLVGTILIPFAIAGFIISWGILKGKGWALISAVILIMGYGRRCNKYRWEHSCLYYTRNYSMYLFRPNVTSYFGRVKIQTP